MATSTALPRTPTNLLTISPLWTIQIIIISALLGFLTFVFGFAGVKASYQIIIPAYIILVTTYLLYLALTIYEITLYFRTRLTAASYLRFQYLKIYISFLELAVLGILVVLGESDDAGEMVLKQAIGLTAISRIPFLFGPVFAWVLWEDDDPAAFEERSEVVRTRAGTRDFGVFETDGERMPLLIKIDPPPAEEHV